MTKVNSIGFTGTQNGLTNKQAGTLAYHLERTSYVEFHHGDCIGADEDSHYFVKSHSQRNNLAIWIIVHPPDNPAKRAFCKGDVILSEKPYLDRNKDIVDASDLLVACPGEDTEQIRSGTWSTIRYARKKNKTIFIIQPNGLLLVEVPR